MDRLIPIEVHINTPMTGVEPMYEYISEISEEFAGPPTGPYMPSASVAYSFNRELPSGSTYKTGWTPIYDTDAYADSLYNRCSFEDEAIATVEIKRSWDESNRTVSGTIIVNFEQSPGNGDYRIGLYVVEDSIQGPFPNYLQWSDYALPNTCDSSYVFDDVLRGEILANSIWGKADIIPSNPSINTDYSINFTYKVPDVMYDIAPRVNHLSLVGFVTSYFPPEAGYSGPHGEIFNVEEIDLIGDNVNNKKVHNTPLNDILVSQKSGVLNFEFSKNVDYNITLFNIAGQKLKSMDVKSLNESIAIDISNISSQTVLIKVTGNNLFYYKPIFITK